MIKVAFLDRDGTIIKDYPDKQWTYIHEPELIDGAIETLLRLQNLDYELIIITNQYLINEGFITYNQYQSITDKLIKVLRSEGIHIKDIFYCPHRRDAGCNCMKPKSGMIDQALARYPSIKIDESFVIGDSECDMELAENIGLKGFWITNQKGSLKQGINRVHDICEIINLVGEDVTWKN